MPVYSNIRFKTGPCDKILRKKPQHMKRHRTGRNMAPSPSTNSLFKQPYFREREVPSGTTGMEVHKGGPFDEEEEEEEEEAHQQTATSIE